MILHCCCGPCSLTAIEELIKKGIKPVLYFYNPNIYPKSEYQKRYQALKIVAKHYHLKLIKGPYNHTEWLNFLKSKLEEPPQNYLENQKRCQVCFYWRLSKTAFWAKKKGFQSFATTLSLSLFKDVGYITSAAIQLAIENGINYYQFETEPRIAHLKNFQLSQNLKLYRQKYCGCEFSMKKNKK